MERKRAFLDATVSRCPHCGAPYADASWYVTELGSDIECGVCERTWNPKTFKTDRILVEFVLDEEGTVVDIKKDKHVE